MPAGLERVVILGNSGFVGSRLERHLKAAHSDLEVVGLSSHDIDLTDDTQSARLADHFSAATGVVVCAGVKSNYGSNLDNYRKNVAMVVNLCRALAASPARRLIFFSSIAVYGVDKHNPRITERTEIVTDSYYGLAKYDSERLLALECQRVAPGGLAIMRMPTMYGPNESIIAPTPSGFLTTYLAGNEVSLFGDGSDLREFVFIDDVLTVVDHLLQSAFAGVLNVGTARGASYRQALDIIAALLGKELVVRHKERTKEKIDKVYDTTLLQTIMPGFVPTPLEDGLRSMLATLR